MSVGMLLVSIAVACAVAAEQEPTAPPLTLDDPLAPLVPVAPRTAEDEERALSAALYAQARLLAQRGDQAGALRRYQRAWRYHPQATFLLADIVRLAQRLRRPDEAVRYALLAPPQTELGAVTWRQLAVHLAARRDYRAALDLYQRALLQLPESVSDAENPEIGVVLMNFEIGRLHFLLDDFAKASEYFSRVDQYLLHPERLSANPSLQKMVLGSVEQTMAVLGESYLNSGRLDRAEEMFRRGLDQPEKAPLLSFQLARLAAKRDQHQQAVALLDEYLQAKQSSAGRLPYELLAAETMLLEPDPGRAERRLQQRLNQAVEHDPANPALLLFVAQRHLAAQQWEAAEKLLLPLEQLDPSLPTYQALAALDARKGREEALLDMLGRAVTAGIGPADLGAPWGELIQDQPRVRQLLALLRKRLGEDRQAASLSGAPMAGVHLALGIRDYPTAEELLAPALEWKQAQTQAQAVFDWGFGLLVARQYAQAARLFRKALEDKLAEERSDLVYFYLARSLALAGEIDPALEVAERAAARFPAALRLQFLPAWVLYCGQRYDPAAQRYEELIRRLDGAHDDPDVRAELRESRLLLSALCVRLDRPDAAEEWLETVLDEFPEDIAALNDLGYLWAEQGRRLPRALSMTRRAVAAEPANSAYLDSLGWVYYRLEQYPEAVDTLEKAAAGESPDGVILDHLGDAYLRAQQPDRALQAWRRAVDAFTDEDASKRAATQQKIRDNEK